MAHEEGIVSEIWRFPVKSMLGEAPPFADFDARGTVGDRLYAVCDADGKLGSGKNTRRMRRMDGLFGFAATQPEGASVPRVTTPSGGGFDVGDPALDDELSRTLGIEVRVRREDAISHFDDSPVHLVTRASLEWLRALLPASRVDPRRFRANLVVDFPGKGPIEESWVGQTLAMGESVVLRVTATTGRCVMTTMPQADLQSDPDILRAVARQADACFGVYADVLRPGRVARGDRVRLLDRVSARPDGRLSS